MDWVGVVEFALAACFDWASVMGDLMSLCSSDGTRSTQARQVSETALLTSK